MGDFFVKITILTRKIEDFSVDFFLLPPYSYCMKSRTDEILAIVDTHKRQEALVSLCRQLEEELNQLKDKYDKLEGVFNLLGY